MLKSLGVKKIKWLILITLINLLSGCSETLPSNLVVATKSDQKINNLYDFDNDKRSEVIFWNSSSMSEPGRFLEKTFFELASPLTGKYTKVGFGEIGDFPIVGYFTEDNILDFGVIRPVPGGRAVWIIKDGVKGNTYNIPLGGAGDLPCPGDFDGDGRTDAAIYKPNEAKFTGYTSTNGSGFQYLVGKKGDIPVVKDYDGDGIADFATYTPSTGEWTIRTSSNGQFINRQLGGLEYVPIPADYDGDGKSDICVWNVKNNLVDGKLSSNKSWIKDSNLEKIQKEISGGKYFPMPLDYDGDGAADIAFWNDDLKILLTYSINKKFKKKAYHFNKIKNSQPVVSLLLKRLYFKNDLLNSPVLTSGASKEIFYFKDQNIYQDSAINNLDSQKKKSFAKWNKSKDVFPFVADFDDDSSLDSCLWSKDTATYLCSSSRVGWKFALPLGLSFDIPFIGRINNDKTPDLGVYRQKAKTFYVRFLGKSSPVSVQEIKFDGDVGDDAIPQIADFDGDGVDNLAVFSASKNALYYKSLNKEEAINFEEKGTPVLGDFDGDGIFDPAVLSSDALNFRASSLGDFVTYRFSINSDGIPFTAKIDNDRRSDIVFYNSNLGSLSIAKSGKSWNQVKMPFMEKGVILSNLAWAYFISEEPVEEELETALLNE